MHSHDRTLLAKLGFNDADRKDPIHDLASQYLALPQHVERILRMCGWGRDIERVMMKCPVCGSAELRDPGAPTAGCGTWSTQRARCDGILEPVYPPGRLLLPKPALERLISKGTGHYSSTIGFADLYIDPVVVEVKISRCTASDLVRQLALYQQHLPRSHSWAEGRQFAAAAVAFDVSPSFVQALDAAGIKLVRLGPKFREWAAAQQAEPLANVDEI